MNDMRDALWCNRKVGLLFGTSPTKVSRKACAELRPLKR
jgi:hypothetical protein